MTNATPVKSQIDEALDKAVNEANRWRGRCINLFARGEQCIMNALANALPDDAPIPMLISQKIKRLAALCESDPEQLALLDAFAALLPTRNALTHGSGRVFIDRSGWLLLLTFQSRRTEMNEQVTDSQAEAVRKQLHATVQRLERGLKP